MLKWLRLVTVILCFNLQVQAQPFTKVSFSIQAHQDDWQLFWSSKVITDMTTAPAGTTKMVFITITAGDASSGTAAYGGGGPFYLSREMGSMYSSKFAADLTTSTAPTDLPVASSVTVNGHTITKYVYKNTVNYFLRLPDGQKDGSGFSNNNFQSLLKLRTNVITTMNVIGNTGTPPPTPPAALTYTWAQLVATVKQIIMDERVPGTQSWVYTPDERTAQPFNWDDHTDHISASYLAQQAVTTAPAMNWVGVDGYIDYYSSTYGVPWILTETQIQNASILFGLETFGMSEEQYQNDFLPDAGHLAWLPIDVFFNRITPTGFAPIF